MAVDDFAKYTLSWAFSQWHSSIDVIACKEWILAEIKHMGFDDRFDAYDRSMLDKFGGERNRPRWADRIGKK